MPAAPVIAALELAVAAAVGFVSGPGCRGPGGVGTVGVLASWVRAGAGAVEVAGPPGKWQARRGVRAEGQPWVQPLGSRCFQAAGRGTQAAGAGVAAAVGAVGLAAVQPSARQRQSHAPPEETVRTRRRRCRRRHYRFQPRDLATAVRVALELALAVGSSGPVLGRRRPEAATAAWHGVTWAAGVATIPRVQVMAAAAVMTVYVVGASVLGVQVRAVATVVAGMAAAAVAAGARKDQERAGRVVAVAFAQGQTPTAMVAAAPGALAVAMCWKLAVARCGGGAVTPAARLARAAAPGRAARASWASAAAALLHPAAPARPEGAAAAAAAARSR